MQEPNRLKDRFYRQRIEARKEKDRAQARKRGIKNAARTGAACVV
jgi:hypothetical protein